MIPLEQQVTSLDLSKRLKELGVKQDSLWYWGERTFANGVDVIDKEKANSSAWVKVCSAFTVAEHGEALPSSIKTDYSSLNYLHIAKLENTKEWLIAYFHDEIRGSTEADARAKMRIWLIKNKLVEVNRNEKNENAKRER